MTKIEFSIKGSSGRPITADLNFEPTGSPKPIVVLVHGFKGFKDWGHFNLIARNFTAAGFVFLKFNFSHNGTTPENMSEFGDLEAFGHNNFNKELDDLGYVLDCISETNGYRLPLENAKTEIDPQQIYLIGHSRGGGIVLIKTYEDERVKKTATWASVSEFGKYWSEEIMAKWQKSGVLHIANARTGQQMPLYWSAYQTYFDNPDRLSIPNAMRGLQGRPIFIAHGTMDDAVPYSAALCLKDWNPNAELFTMEGANHVFGALHPWPYNYLAPDSAALVNATIRFFNA